jgi:hypothetical protein
MNRLLPTLALACVLLASCVGNRARNDALLPAVSMAWPEVRVDFDRGVADGINDGDLTEMAAIGLRSEADLLTSALESGDRFKLYNVLYTTEIQPWASRGISAALEAGEIGPNGAMLLTERLSNFTAAILVLQERATSLLPQPSH